MESLQKILDMQNNMMMSYTKNDFGISLKQSQIELYSKNWLLSNEMLQNRKSDSSQATVRYPHIYMQWRIQEFQKGGGARSRRAGPGSAFDMHSYLIWERIGHFDRSVRRWQFSHLFIF